MSRGVATLFCVSIAAIATRATATGGRFPNVIVRTQDNQRVRFYDELIKGKVVLINFMFTSCPSQCLRATDRLSAVQTVLGDLAGRDVFLISISVDPARDSPAALKRYAEQFHAGPGWTFVTGSTDDIALIEQSMGMYDADRTQHTGVAIYGNDATGTWAATPIMQNAASIARVVRRVTEPPPATRLPELGPDRSSSPAAPAGSSRPGSRWQASRRLQRRPPRRAD